jgi:hypothetical protein
MMMERFLLKTPVNGANLILSTDSIQDIEGEIKWG